MIAGCSNAAGYEISGEEDCAYNRAYSFGGLLAAKLGREPVNIAMGGQSNNAIARSVLCWFNENYDPQQHNVMVLVAWTESCRLDMPYTPPMDYSNPAADWYCHQNRHFINVNPGIQLHENMSHSERRYTTDGQTLIAHYGEHVEMTSWLNVIMLQNYFAAKGIDYVMCNTMHMFTNNLATLVYSPLVDSTRYYNMFDNDRSFYWYYRNKGYENPLAKYWHHSEEPHRLYCEELFEFISSRDSDE